jgi:hypothetical protein
MAPEPGYPALLRHYNFSQIQIPAQHPKSGKQYSRESPEQGMVNRNSDAKFVECMGYTILLV